MDQIIPQYFAGMGFTIHETAAGLVRRLHRGNMEALVEVGRRIRETVPVHKRTLNQQEILAACKLTQFLPRGLKRAEGCLLDRLCVQDLPRVRAEAVSGIFGKIFDNTVNHLTRQFDDKGTHLPMISQVGVKFRITEFGRKFIHTVKAEGFTIN